MSIYSNSAGRMGEQQVVHRNLLCPHYSQLLILVLHGKVGKRANGQSTGMHKGLGLHEEIAKGRPNGQLTGEQRVGVFKGLGDMQSLRSSKGWQFRFLALVLQQGC